MVQLAKQLGILSTARIEEQRYYTKSI